MVLDWLDGENAIIDALAARIAFLEHKFNYLHVENIIKNEKILSIEEELKNAVANDSSWENVLNGGKKTETQINMLNAVGNELREQNNKHNNIMIYGLPLPSASTDYEAEQEDMQLVMELFDEMDIHDIERDIVQLTRLKPCRWSYTPPPIRLELNTDFDRLWSNSEILLAAKRLKYSKKFKKIGISNDLTYSQQKHMKNLIKTRNELNSELNGSEAYRYCIRDFALVKMAI